MYYNGNNGSVATRGYNESMMDTIGSSIGTEISLETWECTWKLIKIFQTRIYQIGLSRVFKKILEMC